MPKEYTCELCKKVFDQKIDFTRHQNKKSPCISLLELQEISRAKEVEINAKKNLITVFKSCLDILRDNEGLTGEKALRNMSYLLILKLLEPHFDGEIDIDNCDEYDFTHLDPDTADAHKTRLLEIARFSVLSKEKQDNIAGNMKFLWDDILSVHPSTKNIFLQGKGFDIERGTTYKKLIDKLASLDLTRSEHDILGNAYEEVIQDIMTGKVLGQFFTQPLIKKMMVKLIDPQIHPDGKIDTCGDPAMGTGGFLITYLQYILHQASIKEIDPDWDFIKEEGLYGKELEPDTYQLAVSNMLISSGHMFEKLERGDSIRDPITRKFDNILANPPFGIKGLKYDDFYSSLKDEYTPIKSDNAVSLFIQGIIYMLKIDGKCAVVLPDGQDLFSKTNKTFIAIREFLMKTCDLKEIIYLPAGIFTYTSIKTCVFYFIKKRENSDVLSVDIKYSNTSQKELKREYKFSKTHKTTKVRFYDYNPYEDIKNLLVEVPIEIIASNSYSLNYAEYLKDETEEDQYEDGIILKTLGEVCTFLGKSKRNAKYGQTNGLYPFFKSSMKVDTFVDEPDYDQESLIIGDGGEPNVNYGVKFTTSDHCYIMQNKDKDNLCLKYAYYYLYHNLDLMKKFYTGVGIKNISKTNIKAIKIPIPPVERQKEIVEYLDFIYEKAIKTSTQKISELKELNHFCINNQKKFGQNETKELGCLLKSVKTGKDLISTKRLEGVYPFYGANGIIDYVDDYIFDGKYLLTARTGSLGSLHISNGKFWCSGDVHRIEFENDILLKYVYYYLQTVNFQKFRTGLAHPKLSGSSLKSIKICVPLIEKQKEIVQYCEFNDRLIEELEKEIKNNKYLAQQVMNSVVKVQSHQDDTVFDNPIEIVFVESDTE